MSAAQQGFILTRHWRDTPAGIEVDYWLATDSGPVRLRIPSSRPLPLFLQIVEPTLKSLSLMSEAAG